MKPDRAADAIATVKDALEDGTRTRVPEAMTAAALVDIAVQIERIANLLQRISDRMDS